MSDRFPTDPAGPYKAPAPDLFRQHPPLPPWLARRLLRPDEEVTWVRGPRFNPFWERYVTHFGLFLAALAVAGACVALGRLSADSWAAMPVAPVLVAIGLVFGTIYVLAIANAYFTRLVVTNSRIVLMQGYEVCRGWSIHALPRSLRRYRVLADGKESWSVDLGALQTMIGGASDQFADSKTLRAFGKQLDQIKAREDRRPDSGRTQPGG
jgi:hypothetical protein